jgi:hypothetical protein
VVDIDPFRFDAERRQRVALGGEVLLRGGDPGVADLDAAHGRSVAG